MMFAKSLYCIGTRGGGEKGPPLKRPANMVRDPTGFHKNKRNKQAVPFSTGWEDTKQNASFLLFFLLLFFLSSQPQT